MSDAPHWRSLDELADTPEFRRFLESEFPDMAPRLLTPATRRQFLKLMGASVALAGLSGCRWPQEKIAPFGSRPEGRIPGVPVEFATACERNGVALGVLAVSYDGRPIKLEGNPLHPASRGATDAFTQAGILELYDPDRLTAVVERLREGERFNRAWADFAAFAQAHFAARRPTQGAGLAVLSEAASGPTFARLRERFRAVYPRAGWYEYEPLSSDAEREGTRLLFGRPHRVHLRLAEAEVIVALDADLLMTHPAAVSYARDFMSRRDVDASPAMNRLYAAESHYSVTGSTADRRVALPAHHVPALACGLAAALVEQGLHVPDEIRQLASDLAGLAAPPAAEREFIQSAARDLAAGRGRGIIAAGPRQPAEVHTLVAALNAALGNAGHTVVYTEDPDPARPTHVDALRALVAEISAGRVDTLLVLGGNPVFNAPVDLAFGEILPAVRTVIHLSLYENETTALAQWHLPRAHFLESWDDARSYDGTLSVVQPLIEPFYGGRTPGEVLALLLSEEPNRGYDLVQQTWRPLAGSADFETFWTQVLHDGLAADSAWPAGQPAAGSSAWIAALLERVRAADRRSGLEIVFVPDSHVYDGRFANNGWLQELPDPLTKLTWDNAALVSPATARRLGVERGQFVRLEVEGHGLEIPVFIMPGQADESVALPLGYGRRVGGRIAAGTGYDTYRLRTSRAMDCRAEVQVTPLQRSATLAVTQDHHAISSEVGVRETGRRAAVLVQEADLAEYRRHPDFAQHAGHHPPLVSLWEERAPAAGHRWGLVIDLNRCTGCAACVVACQAENNIPVVGKEEVDRGREMHWLRVDRYFRGEPQAPSASHQPVPCMQCENAPCEQVCPVAATVHSDEGLNDMVYNRCIGTRYCSNNCPYKVRRFNWFNNHRDHGPTEKLLFNPEVTVRSRGVMEKCTYCVQRINAVKIRARNEARAITDGEITPACAQTCPTQAVTFGDLNDPQSRVARLAAGQRCYSLLAELNIKPRTRYLARVRNAGGVEGPGAEGSGGGGAGH